MGAPRVPTWYAATGLQAENHRVYDAFRQLLHHLPMSYTELAARIGVSQPAVSRWALDKSHPSLDEMAAAYAAVAEHLDEIHDRLDRFGEVLGLIEQALRLHEGDPVGSTSGPVADDPVDVGATPVPPAPLEDRRRKLTRRLRHTLGIPSDAPDA